MPTELILALDAPTRDAAYATLNPIGRALKWVKVGLQLFTREGPDVVRAVADMGYNVFLDLKLHDIPNTVASAIRSLKGLPVQLLTIHTCGGSEMMRWAAEAAKETNPNLKILGVTVLTSMDAAQLREVGVSKPPAAQVLALAKLARASGIDGLVCSPLELPLLSAELGKDTLLVTPGIRPLGADCNEQKRVMTPKAAALAGATHIVMGRPILRAPDPAAAVRAVLDELENAR